MEKLTGGKTPVTGGAAKGLAWLGAALATAGAAAVAAVLAMVFAAAVVVIAVMGTAVLSLAGLAMRAERRIRKDKDDPDLIEARHVGGGSWVAYGLEPRGR